MDAFTSSKTCRTCNKENFVFCDIYHDVIKKIMDYIPNLININDQKLQHINKVCTNCFLMIKNITYQIENIMDIQKILQIEQSIHSPLPSTPTTNVSFKKETIKAEDIAKKYSNIKVRKVSLCTSSPTKEEDVKINEKLIVIDPLPDEQTPKKPKLSESPQKMLMCISCSQKFTDFNLLQNHLKSCKNSSNHPLKCFCGKVLSTKKEFAIHVFSQHKENKRKHICTVCKNIFTSLYNLQNHMLSHKSSSEIKGTFWCQQCDAKFNNSELLKKHRGKCSKKTIEV